MVVNNLAQTSSGYLDSVTNASDVLSGSMTIELGNGTTENIVIGAAPTQPAANTIYTGSGKDTLADIKSAINSANLGLTANVLADSSGSRLSLVSVMSGAAGLLTARFLADRRQQRNHRRPRRHARLQHRGHRQRRLPHH